LQGRISSLIRAAFTKYKLLLHPLFEESYASIGSVLQRYQHIVVEDIFAISRIASNLRHPRDCPLGVADSKHMEACPLVGPLVANFVEKLLAAAALP
jgi:hypothetical protein